MREEREAHIARLNRQQNRLIDDCQKNALDGRTEGWYITLNTKAIIDERTDVDKVKFECDILERQLRAFSSRLNEFCYRRRKSKSLRVMAGIEIGEKESRLHAHLIVAHSGDVDKTLHQVLREVAKQWQRVYEFDKVGFIRVEEIYDMHGLIGYVSKDLHVMLRAYKVDSVRPF